MSAIPAQLPAITIRQPWASAVAYGHKHVENRGRATSYRGPVAIHAALRHSSEGDRDPRILRTLGPDPRLHAPVGAVIAVAQLTDCHQQNNGCCPPWGDQEYQTARGPAPAWHLVLTNVRRLTRPVPATGRLPVPWLLDADTTTAVHAQLPTTQE